MSRRKSAQRTDGASQGSGTRTSPSFKGLSPASIQSSRSKRANRSSGTRHEEMLRRELLRLGLRYRKNDKRLPGRPDVVFSRARLAVFCDGDFWHGRDWDLLQE